MLMSWFVSRSNGSRIGSRINEQFATAGPLDLLPSGEEFLHSIAGNPVTLAGKIGLYKGPARDRDFLASADCKRVSNPRTSQTYSKISVVSNRELIIPIYPRGTAFPKDPDNFVLSLGCGLTRMNLPS